MLSCSISNWFSHSSWSGAVQERRPRIDQVDDPLRVRAPGHGASPCASSSACANSSIVWNIAKRGWSAGAVDLPHEALVDQRRDLIEQLERIR